MTRIEAAATLVICDTSFCTHWTWCVDCCFIWKGAVNAYGYGIVSYYKTYSINRLMYYWFHGRSPRDDRTINHKCHNKRCWNPAHLYEGTLRENSMDRRLHNRGVDLLDSKLNDAIDAESMEHRVASKRFLVMIMDHYRLSPRQAVDLIYDVNLKYNLKFTISEEELDDLEGYWRKLRS